MFKNKKDPLADTIKGIMNRTALRNKVEEALNEQLGVSSRKAIPHEYLAQYDAMLAEQHAQAEEKTGASTSTEGDKAEAASLESKKDLPNSIANRLMKQGSYTPSARGSLKKLQEKLSPKQEKLAAKAGNRNKIEAADLEALRQDKTLDEQQLQEKATEAQKEKVARVMREYKKGKLHSGSKEGPKVTDKEQAVAIALSQAGLSNKKKMDESLQSIQEEIRNNLIQKLNYIYESEGEDAANAYFETLSEQERGILSEVEAKLSGMGQTGPGRFKSFDRPVQRPSSYYERQVARVAPAPSATSATSAAPPPSLATRLANMGRGVANMARKLGPPGSIASMIPASFGKNYIEPALHNIGLGKILNVPNAPTGNEPIRGTGKFVPNRRFVPPKSEPNTPTPSKTAATSDVAATANIENEIDKATSNRQAASDVAAIADIEKEVDIATSNRQAAPAARSAGGSRPTATATSRPGGSLERVGSTSIARRPSGEVSSTYTPRTGPERDWKQAAFNPDSGG